MGLETVNDSYRLSLLHRCIEDITMATFNFVFVDETKKSQESKEDSKKSLKEICDTCGKQFFARKNLMQHKLTHTKDTTNCDICNKKISN